MSVATSTKPVIALRKSDRGALAGGGTVTFEVYLDGQWIGWVGDERRFTGVRFGGRRWWAAWREDGDRAARWNATAYRTRAAAVAALITTADPEH